jgi:hypothetical protein
MSREEQYELFEAYLHQTLSEEEASLFQELMKEDEHKKAFEEYEAIQNAYRHVVQQSGN